MGVHWLHSLSPKAAGKLHVLGHDRDALGVDGAQVGVLKQANKARLGRLLKGADGLGRKAQVGLECDPDLAPRGPGAGTGAKNGGAIGKEGGDDACLHVFFRP